MKGKKRRDGETTREEKEERRQDERDRDTHTPHTHTSCTTQHSTTQGRLERQDSFLILRVVVQGLSSEISACEKNPGLIFN